MSETYTQWRRRVLQQYPKATIETMKVGNAIIGARATYDGHAPISTWTKPPTPA